MESVDLTAKHTDQVCRVQVPTSDIDACVKFSWVRCAFTIVGLLLVSSDVPRTGYGVRSLTSAFEQVAPNTYMYFGPYAYGVAQIQKPNSSASNSSDEYQGTCESEPIASTEVWSYKFDSLSIGLRGIARLAGSAEWYPRCLLYLEECPSALLSLETTFKMLDGLVSVLGELREPSELNATAPTPPLVYQTQSYWVDRLYHVLLGKLTWWRIDKRSHAVHFYRGRRHRDQELGQLSLCSSVLHRSRNPMFCDLLVAWDFESTTSSKRTRISEHIVQRLVALEQQHPALSFDLTVFTTYFPTPNTHAIKIVPTAHVRTEGTEVTTIIRGRVCSASSSSSDPRSIDCETLLVDDYRYEAALLETNAEELVWLTTSIRSLAQGYVWVRLLLLWFGCYYARRQEPRFAVSTLSRRVFLTWLTIFKIPSHVVVYGSWFPIILYSAAHYIDSALVHTVCENVWASLNGAVQLDFLVYVNVASVQMRNIWYIALVVKCLSALQVYALTQRSSPWVPGRGLVGLRGGLLGFVSSVTIFAYVRSVAFRNTQILTVTEFPFEWLRVQHQFSRDSDNVSEFGLPFDARLTLMVATGVACAVMVAKAYLVCGDSALHRRIQQFFVVDSDAATRVAFSRLRYVPLSVGTLVPLSALSLFWKITIQRSKSSPRPARKRSSVSNSTVGRSRKVYARDATPGQGNHDTVPDASASSNQLLFHQRGDRKVSALGNEHAPEPPQHVAFLRVETRTKELWSVVKLMHIALFTEPLTLLRLYFYGREFYLYQAVDSSVQKYCPSEVENHDGVSTPQELFLLPCDPATLSRSFEYGDEDDGYQLVGAVDSRDVPWRLLVFCG